MRQAAVLLAAGLGLGACADLPEVASERASLVEFELAGRIAVRYSQEAVTGNVAWRHGRESDELLITSPVGGAVARIVRERGGVTLTQGNGDEHRAADAEALTERVLGFRLPLEGLADWVRARAAPGAGAVTQLDPAGRLSRLEQNGWRVDYLEYQAAQSGAMPTRIVLYYPGLELRLAIHDWKVP